MVHIRTLMDVVAENIEIDEGRMKDIFTANQEGKSAKEIAKALKLPLGTVKKILGEDKEEINEFTDSQLDVLARQYAGLKGKTISVDQANKLRQIFNRIPDRSLDALRRKKIPFLSGLALSRMVQKGMPVKSESLEEAKYTINYEVESDSGADDRYTGNQEITVNAFSPKDAVKKYGQQVNKTVKQAQARGSKSILSVYMNYIEKDGNEISDKEVDKLNDYASDFIYKGVYDSYMKEARWQIEGQLSYRGIGSYDGFHMVIDAPNERAAEQKAYKELDKARDRKKIGPGGGGSVEDAEIESIERTSDRLQAPSTYRVSEYNPADEVKEGKAPYRLSYDDRYGKHAGFEDAKTLQDLQNKAANLRKRGFVINKMGRNTSPVKEDRHAGAKLVYETIKGLKNKAEKSGMPYSILKKVYDRGMAAWRGGHRPGTTQQQWAFARVNSFVTKSSGTWGGADKDLAKQVRGKN